MAEQDASGESAAKQWTARNWQGPWWKTPGFAAVHAPLGIGILALLVGSLLASLLTPLGAVLPGLLALVRLGILLLVAALWGAAMHRTWQFFGGIRGPLLALLTHGLIMGYLVALVSFLAALNFVGTVLHERDKDWGDWGWFAAGVAVAAVAFGLGCACFRGQQFIARQCKWHYRGSL